MYKRQVQEGVTRPPEQAQFEAHDIYADLQLLCRGGERVEWADRAVLSESVPYDADKDIAFFHGSGVEMCIRDRCKNPLDGGRLLMQGKR